MKDKETDSLSFEDSLKKLQETADMIKGKNLTLDQTADCYEQGKKYYERCKLLLNSAKQKINFFGEDEDERRL